MPKKVAKNSSKKASPKKKEFHLTITTSDEVFDTEADSVLEGINLFPVPPVFKTKTVFVVKRGDSTREKHLNTAEARRVFSNETARILLADALTKLL